MTLLYRSLTRALRTSPAHVYRRAFHSPFASLTANVSAGTTTTTPQQHTATTTASHGHYEKQADHSPDPQSSHAGTPIYVVSPPDPANVPYSVPAGAYRVDAPFPASSATKHANRP